MPTGPVVSGTPAKYPAKFDDFEPSGIPAEPNIKFTIVLAAPKKYVWDSWHLPKDKGGGNVPITKGDPGDVYWPGCTENMERNAGPATEVVGKISTPDEGPWVRLATSNPCVAAHPMDISHAHAEPRPDCRPGC